MGVDSLDQLGGGGQRIECGMGAGSVAAGTLEEDFEFLGAGGQWAVAVADLAGVEGGIDMEGDDGVDLLESPGLNHFAGSGGGFLGRLEDTAP